MRIYRVSIQTVVRLSSVSICKSMFILVMCLGRSLSSNIRWPVYRILLIKGYNMITFCPLITGKTASTGIFISVIRSKLQFKGAISVSINM